MPEFSAASRLRLADSRQPRPRLTHWCLEYLACPVQCEQSVSLASAMNYQTLMNSESET